MVRLKNRYFLFEILYPDNLEIGADFPVLDEAENARLLRQTPSKAGIDGRTLTRAFKDAVHQNFGDYGLGTIASSLSVKYFSSNTSLGIVRVSRDHFRTLWAAMSYISHINGVPVIITVKRASGTIKKCEFAAMAHDKRLIDLHLDEKNDGDEEGELDDS